MTMCEKKALAKAIEIQKKIGGNHAFFRDKLNFNLAKNSIHELLCILMPFKIIFA